MLTSDRAKREIIIATLIILICTGGLAIIGLNAAPSQSSEITPLFPSEPSTELIPPVIQVAVTATPIAESVQVTVTPNPSPLPVALRTPTRGPARTATPVSVLVGTQKRSYIFYQGPATYVRTDAFAPLALPTFPRPTNNNGRGLHWFPTTRQSRAVIDRFIPELTAMHIRWVVILQGMNDWDLVANDYLVDSLNGAGITPIMRIVASVGEMDYRRLGWIVARYRERGIRYFQVFNEPNLAEEWTAPVPHSPEQFANYWVQAAEVVAANGGLPGLSPLSPRADSSDLAFFTTALVELKGLRRYDLLNLMWIGVHNYGGMNTEGFWRYRRYDATVKQVLGASLPIIATEGGMETAAGTESTIAAIYTFVEREREPYLLAFAPWLIGNKVGGGHDPLWEAAAWYGGTLDRIEPRPVVDQVKRP